MPDSYALALVQRNLLGFVVGVVILTAALLALALFFLRARARERALLWFALFAGLYATRMLAGNQLTSTALGWPQFWRFTNGLIDYAIIIPALLFAYELLGPTWRPLYRVGFWVQVIYAVAAVLAAILSGNPHKFPDPGVLILGSTIAAIHVIGYFRGYRLLRDVQDRHLLGIAFTIFFAFILNEHFGFRGFEPVGFLIFIGIMGLVAVRRALRNEERLLAVEQEMASARQIQASILPAGTPRIAGAEISVRYAPMTDVAGDFYDFLPADSAGFGTLVADVSGHGVPAALIASMVKVALASQQEHASDPARVLHGLNEIFCKQIQGAQFVTAAYVFLDLARRRAVYAGAGHPPLLVWRRASQTLERHEENGLIMGFQPSASYANLTIPLAAGDRLLLYTDGLLEATNAAGEAFEDRLDRSVAANAHLDSKALAGALFAELSAWSARGSRAVQEDDLTLIVIDIE